MAALLFTQTRVQKTHIHTAFVNLHTYSIDLIAGRTAAVLLWSLCPLSLKGNTAQFQLKNTHSS